VLSLVKNVLHPNIDDMSSDTSDNTTNGTAADAHAASAAESDGQTSPTNTQSCQQTTG